MFGNKETKDSREPRDIREVIRETPEPVVSHTPIQREEKVNSVIGEHVSFNGTLKVEGSIVIHGEVEGNITCTDKLTIGRTGRVKADLDVGSANIAGRVEGRIFAKERVELQTASHLKGDVHAKSFVIQDGCFFQGNCAMGEAHQPSARSPLADLDEPKRSTEEPKRSIEEPKDIKKAA